jgi:hypothetical protein
VPVHRVFLGLRHRWFSAEGRPARHGNRVDVFMDGETAWSSVYTDVKAAKSEILAASWWWESDFELVRPSNHATLTPEQRWQNTMLGAMESNTAIVRVLVGQFWGQDGVLSGLTVDDYMLAYAAQAGDGIEYMGQANQTEGTFQFAIPSFAFSERVRASSTELADATFDEGEALIDSTVPQHAVDLTEWPVDVDVQHASYHQKFSVIDHEVAYIGGMNVKATDWDTSAHHVYDARRMGFDATTEEREAVMNKEADSETGPRKDYIVRVEGPAAQDAADVFKKRWDHQRSAGAEYAENASAFEIVRDVAPRSGGQQVQVTATLPEPFWEHAIAETWFNAVNNAERFIFIEDQYFRIPCSTTRSSRAWKRSPTWCWWSSPSPSASDRPRLRADAPRRLLVRDELPGRYVTLQLRAFDTVETWGFDETESRFADIGRALEGADRRRRVREHRLGEQEQPRAGVRGRAERRPWSTRPP